MNLQADVLELRELLDRLAEAQTRFDKTRDEAIRLREKCQSTTIEFKRVRTDYLELMERIRAHRTSRALRPTALRS